jgi:Beta-propeller repeat
VAALSAVRRRGEPDHVHIFASSSLASNIGISAIAVDAAASTYITGTTFAGGITTTPGAFRSQISGGYCSVSPFPISCVHAFVIKLDPRGGVVFATYLGGSKNDFARAIAVDPQGNVYVAGQPSPDFPVTPGAAFTNPAGGATFVAKLNPSGSQLVYSTFIPTIEITALALDADGNVYVAGGAPTNASFPTTPGAFQVSPKAGSLSAGAVAKLNASGSALIYATYLSGSGAGSQGGDSPESIAVDAAGNAFIAGSTRSTDFPVTSGAFQTTSPSPRSVFLTKLNPQGTGLVYSTYLGETHGYASSVKVDAQGSAFVSGSTNSTAFPTTPGATTSGAGGVVSGFLTRFSADGSSLIYSMVLPTFNPSAGLEDPILLIGAPMLLASLAMLACYVPASRSTKIDPLQALREE